LRAAPDAEARSEWCCPTSPAPESRAPPPLHIHIQTLPDKNCEIFSPRKDVFPHTLTWACYARGIGLQTDKETIWNFQHISKTPP
jgi:hypothetical protein